MTTSPSAPLGVDDIPGPPGLPLLGNMFDVPAKRTIETLMDLTRRYGPIVRLRTPRGDRFIVSGLEMIDDLCDDSRFDKLVGDAQKALRETRPSNGLFTADTDDPDWRKAHNILLPNFSMQAMRGYLPMMIDIADQLMQKWERLNPGEQIDVTEDMTRLTLDTIALCGFGFRFNSFYRDTQHPFVQAMMDVLGETQKRSRQLPAQIRMRRRGQHALEAGNSYMEAEVARIVDERRRAGTFADQHDLLSCMLSGVDKRSGEQLSDANIVAQCVTFLIAGHETTSGLLSFAIAFLIKHPEVMQRAQDEVDRVLGTDPSEPPDYAQVQQLSYVTQILNETLRLWPTASAFTRYPYQDDTVGGYLLPKGASISALTPMLHRIPAIWGPDAEEFNPDHFLPEARAALPPNAFKPFGSGQRACIGRQFAMQEAVLVLGMLLQRFDLVDQLDYQLKIKESLTIKPAGLRITVRARTGRTTGALRPLLAAPAAAASAAVPEPAITPVSVEDRHGTPLLVLFGSNLGTAEGIAGKLAQEGTDRGYAVTLGALDEHSGQLPRDGALLVVCASYNGTPPDNAEQFCRWITADTTDPHVAGGLVFSVFGCGNMDWASTYQAVPTLIDTQLAAHGARRVHPRGEGDARSDFDGQYHTWHTGLWDAVAASLDLPTDAAQATVSTQPRLQLSMTKRRPGNPAVQSYRALPAIVTVNRELCHLGATGPQERSTRHLELRLPPGLGYATGDHLGVLPQNDPDTVRRVLDQFDLDDATDVTITPTSGSYTHLPLGEPTPLRSVLTSCVELQDMANRDHLSVMSTYTTDPAQRAELKAMSQLDDDGRAAYRERVAVRNASVLDLLEEYPSCALPFTEYLDLLAPMRPRYYSISSSPLATSTCDLTVGVLIGDARNGNGTFRGVASNYLARCSEGSTVFVFVRKPTIAFRPPENPHLPMVMISAGTGMAPFRGFLQDRATMATQGVPVGPALMFFGCRSTEIDYLYADQLAEFERSGVCELAVAFSRRPDAGRGYVQHLVERDQKKVWDLLEHGGTIYVCGNAQTMAPGVRAAMLDMYRANTGGDEVAAQRWLTQLQADGRYLEDIWSEKAPAL